MKSTAARIKLDWKKLLAFNQVKFSAAGEAGAPVNPAKAMVGGKGPPVGTLSYLSFYIVTESSKRGFGSKFASL